MATITIENVPETFVKKYYKTTFSYNEIIFKPKGISNISYDESILDEAIRSDGIRKKLSILSSKL